MTNREIDAKIESEVFHFHEPISSLWVRKFSTNPIRSKQLRDKMRADGFHFIITSTTDSTFACTFYRGVSDPGKILVSASEEMAVALAALRAVGVEVCEGMVKL